MLSIFVQEVTSLEVEIIEQHKSMNSNITQLFPTDLIN